MEKVSSSQSQIPRPSVVKRQNVSLACSECRQKRIKVRTQRILHIPVLTGIVFWYNSMCELYCERLSMPLWQWSQAQSSYNWVVYLASSTALHRGSASLWKPGWSEIIHFTDPSLPKCSRWRDFSPSWEQTGGSGCLMSDDSWTKMKGRRKEDEGFGIGHKSSQLLYIFLKKGPYCSDFRRLALPSCYGRSLQLFS